VVCKRCGNEIAKPDRDGRGAIIFARPLLAKADGFEARCPSCKAAVSFTQNQLKYIVRVGTT